MQIINLLIDYFEKSYHKGPKSDMQHEGTRNTSPEASVKILLEQCAGTTDCN